MTPVPHDPEPHTPAPEAGQPANDWDRLVARAQQEQSAVATTRPERRYPRRGMLTALGLLLVTGGAAWQLTQVAVPDDAERDRGRRALLALIDSSLADHLRLHGTYPESLQEVLPLQLEVEYRRTENGYVATVRLSDGTPLTVSKP